MSLNTHLPYDDLSVISQERYGVSHKHGVQIADGQAVVPHIVANFRVRSPDNREVSVVQRKNRKIRFP